MINMGPYLEIASKVRGEFSTPPPNPIHPDLPPRVLIDCDYPKSYPN